jgi:hypothetical protein
MSVVTAISDWLENHIGFTIAIAAAWVIVLVVSVWAVRYFLITIPPDYFAKHHRPLERWRQLHPTLRWTLLIGKNLLGALLAAAGLVMLFTPGQGLLALLLGVSLLDVPGKRALERRIVRQPSVLRLVNHMRAKAQQPPLVFDASQTGSRKQ